MLIDRVVSLRRANIYPTHHYRHVLSTARITAVEPTLIRAQTSYVVFQTRNNGETTIYNECKTLKKWTMGLIVRTSDPI
jgi:anthranilate 1,2-dioxygenase small subunit